MKKFAKKNKKNCPGPPPLEQIFFLWGTKGKKLPLGHQMEKKTSFGGPREKKSSSRGLKKGSFFFPFGAPKEVFFPLVPQRKKFAQGVEDQGNFFFFFWQFFSTCEKINQF